MARKTPCIARRFSGTACAPGDPFSAAVFHSLTFAEEQSLLMDLRAWNRQRANHGYHAITWPVEYGGLGLTQDHARAFASLEDEYETPRRHELSTAPPPEPIETELIRRVERLDLAYWGAPSPDQPAGWQSRWDGRDVPELIRVRLGFAKGDRRRWPDLITAPQR